MRRPKMMDHDLGSLLRLPAVLPAGELSEDLVAAGSFRVERIVSTGQSSPPGFWYDQDEDEWVALLQGDAALEFEEGEIVRLGAGDWVFLPAGLRHRVASTSSDPPCIWLAVFGRPARPGVEP
ncbi:MAG: cupin domain-containing protein [Synergistaceae bacterium]|nr:cupin domain-containing protein [Synergistota bacterium]NLM71324.1 cupin domain-containing protein [Synergistaceae bacterium]